jgi:hypothetical protein
LPVGASAPPESGLPHALIKPLALRAAKASVVVPRFTQQVAPLSPLKLMAQSRHGVNQILEVKKHPLVGATPIFILNIKIKYQ